MEDIMSNIPFNESEVDQLDQLARHEPRLVKLIHACQLLRQLPHEDENENSLDADDRLAKPNGRRRRLDSLLTSLTTKWNATAELLFESSHMANLKRTCADIELDVQESEAKLRSIQRATSQIEAILSDCQYKSDRFTAAMLSLKRQYANLKQLIACLGSIDRLINAVIRQTVDPCLTALFPSIVLDQSSSNLIFATLNQLASRSTRLLVKGRQLCLVQLSARCQFKHRLLDSGSINEDGEMLPDTSMSMTTNGWLGDQTAHELSSSFPVDLSRLLSFHHHKRLIDTTSNSDLSDTGALLGDRHSTSVSFSWPTEEGEPVPINTHGAFLLVDTSRSSTTASSSCWLTSSPSLPVRQSRLPVATFNSVDSDYDVCSTPLHFDRASSRAVSYAPDFHSQTSLSPAPSIKSSATFDSGAASSLISASTLPSSSLDRPVSKSGLCTRSLSAPANLHATAPIRLDVVNDTSATTFRSCSLAVDGASPHLVTGQCRSLVDDTSSLNYKLACSSVPSDIYPSSTTTSTNEGMTLSYLPIKRHPNGLPPPAVTSINSNTEDDHLDHCCLFNGKSPAYPTTPPQSNTTTFSDLSSSDSTTSHSSPCSSEVNVDDVANTTIPHGYISDLVMGGDGGDDDADYDDSDQLIRNSSFHAYHHQQRSSEHVSTSYRDAIIAYDCKLEWDMSGDLCRALSFPLPHNQPYQPRTTQSLSNYDNKPPAIRRLFHLSTPQNSRHRNVPQSADYPSRRMTLSDSDLVKSNQSLPLSNVGHEFKSLAHCRLVSTAETTTTSLTSHHDKLTSSSPHAVIDTSIDGRQLGALYPHVREASSESVNSLSIPDNDEVIIDLLASIQRDSQPLTRLLSRLETAYTCSTTVMSRSDRSSLSSSPQGGDRSCRVQADIDLGFLQHYEQRLANWSHLVNCLFDQFHVNRTSPSHDRASASSFDHPSFRSDESIRDLDELAISLRAFADWLTSLRARHASAQWYLTRQIVLSDHTHDLHNDLELNLTSLSDRVNTTIGRADRLLELLNTANQSQLSTSTISPRSFEYRRVEILATLGELHAMTEAAGSLNTRANAWRLFDGFTSSGQSQLPSDLATEASSQQPGETIQQLLGQLRRSIRLLETAAITNHSFSLSSSPHQSLTEQAPRLFSEACLSMTGDSPAVDASETVRSSIPNTPSARLSQATLFTLITLLLSWFLLLLLTPNSPNCTSSVDLTLINVGPFHVVRQLFCWQHSVDGRPW